MTNAEARFNKSLRPRKPEGSLGRTAQDGHLDSHTAPELSLQRNGEKLNKSEGQKFEKHCAAVFLSTGETHEAIFRPTPG